MKTLFIATVAIMAMVPIASAKSLYNPQTGNTYVTHQGSNGTHVNGYNAQNGSNWNTRVQNNGNAQGVDSRGNNWNYNAKSGGYYNSNGRNCYGKGAYRTCN